MRNTEIENDPAGARKRWAEHPNYPEQVLLLGSHDNFRALSGRLVEAASEPDLTRAEGKALGALYRRWIAAMRSHEAYEERKLYPYLTARFGVSFAEAEAGHRALHEADAAVRAAIPDDVDGSDDAFDAAALAEAFARHDAVLREHLRVEEDLVIPRLLDLSPKEFNAYYWLPLDALLDRLRSQGD